MDGSVSVTEGENSQTEQSRQFLEQKRIHEQWESDYLNPDLESFYDQAMVRVVQLLGARPGATILDGGCGYAFHAARLAQQGLKVTGVDFSAAALKQARAFVNQRGLGDRIELREGDLLNLPFPDNHFDYVSSWGVLMHIPEVEKALAELVRVCKPGGGIALMENNVHSLHVRLWEPGLRLVKTLLRRRNPEIRRSPRGKEEWYQDGSAGGLLVRKVDVSWLEAQMRGLGAELRDRHAGQLTEIYTSLPWLPAKRAIYALNRLWFQRVRRPGPAMGNILVFEKASARRSD
jgi:ubiquinone/menaquinone biosynthesis C-methylase UbiE